MAEALKKLPTEFRMPVILRDLEEWSYEEIAVSLDLPVGTVKSRIARGRGQLRTILLPLLEREKDDRVSRAAAHPARSLDFLSRLHDGELTAAERAHFESHRAHCDECRRAAADFEATLASYRTTGTPAAKPDLAARILRRLETPRAGGAPPSGSSSAST